MSRRADREPRAIREIACTAAWACAPDRRRAAGQASCSGRRRRTEGSAPPGFPGCRRRSSRASPPARSADGLSVRRQKETARVREAVHPGARPIAGVVHQAMPFAALVQAQLPGSRDQLVEIGCGGGAAGRKRAKQAQETAPAARRGGHRAAGKKNTQWTATGCPLAEYELEALQIEAAYCASSRSELRTCFSATTICSVAALSDGKIRERFSWTTRLNAARCSSRTPIR